MTVNRDERKVGSDGDCRRREAEWTLSAAGGRRGTHACSHLQYASFASRHLLVVNLVMCTCTCSKEDSESTAHDVTAIRVRVRVEDCSESGGNNWKDDGVLIDYCQRRSH